MFTSALQLLKSPHNDQVRWGRRWSESSIYRKVRVGIAATIMSPLFYFHSNVILCAKLKWLSVLSGLIWSYWGSKSSDTMAIHRSNIKNIISCLCLRFQSALWLAHFMRDWCRIKNILSRIPLRLQSNKEAKSRNNLKWKLKRCLHNQLINAFPWGRSIKTGHKHYYLPRKYKTQSDLVQPLNWVLNTGYDGIFWVAMSDGSCGHSIRQGEGCRGLHIRMAAWREWRARMFARGPKMDNAW
jgi:hypothetical protein